MPLGEVFEVPTCRSRSPVGPYPAALDMPHELVKWVTMPIVTREGDRRCKLPAAPARPRRSRLRRRPEPALAHGHHRTRNRRGQGVSVCGQGVFSGRIVGYSIDTRMKSSLAVRALDSPVARRGQVAGCIVRSDRGSQFRSRKFVAVLARHGMIGRWGKSVQPATRSHGELLRAAAEERTPLPCLAHLPGTAERDRHLDRAHLPPPPASETPGPIDPTEYETIMTPLAALSA